jgi:drug/metabolite transporter (DMT)-like permease
VLFGIGLKVFSTLVFSIMSAMIKTVGSNFPVGELVFFRSLFALPVLIVWLIGRGEFPRAIHTSRVLGHIGRGIAGSCGMVASFWALRLLPLPDATAFGFASPLMVVVLAALVLGERVRAYRWSAVAIGFLGVLVMLSSQWAQSHSGGIPTNRLGALVALTSALFSAMATIQTRRLTLSEGTGAIVFYFSLTTTFFGLLSGLLPLVWPKDAPLAPFVAGQAWQMPAASEGTLLVVLGSLGGLGQILMTHSYRYADASVIAPFDYTSMLWALLIGLFILDEEASFSILIGAAIVAAAGIFVIWREKQLGLLGARREIASRPL